MLAIRERAAHSREISEPLFTDRLAWVSSVPNELSEVRLLLMAVCSPGAGDRRGGGVAAPSSGGTIRNRSSSLRLTSCSRLESTVILKKRGEALPPADVVVEDCDGVGGMAADAAGEEDEDEDEDDDPSHPEGLAVV